MSLTSSSAIFKDSTNTYQSYSPFPFLLESKSYWAENDDQTRSPSVESISTTEDNYQSPDQALTNSEMTTGSNYDNETNDGGFLVNAGKQLKKKVTDDTKFKTEMCKNWSETGRCPYGKKCKFAHGRNELNGKSAGCNNRYKSKKCMSFYNNQFCPYGSRCMFLHESRTFEDVLGGSFYSRFIQCPDVMNTKAGRPQQRLRVFTTLEQECQAAAGGPVYAMRPPALYHPSVFSF